MDTNFTSFVALNTLFLQQLAEAKLASQITVVNISSLCAVKGMASFSLYSAG